MRGSVCFFLHVHCAGLRKDSLNVVSPFNVISEKSRHYFKKEKCHRLM